MNISFHWLKDYLDFHKTPEEIADILTQTGLEVDGISYQGEAAEKLGGVVTGHVLSCAPHPNADKLKITTVNVGTEVLTIVCGAPNVEEGQKVLVALVGSTIHPQNQEPVTLRKAKIRGVESNGMICAEDELGLGNSHDGIMILPQETPIGIPASLALSKESNAILEIGLTPNRCDAMGHIGVARDIKAYLNFHEGKQLQLLLPTIINTAKPLQSETSFLVEEGAGCASYFVAHIKGIKVTDSAAEISQKLTSIGVSSINNVVDCANFVMHELGYPLHVFDARFFKKELRVRLATEEESLVTLEGTSRKLKPNDIVIAGDGNVHCLAGIMGGKESGVQNDTQDIFIEAAFFNPSSIRKSSKHHNIHSDASFRFERGVDPNATHYALQRAVDLILRHAGGTFEGIKEVHASEVRPEQIELTPEKVNQVLGSNFTKEAISGILESLDFTHLGENTWAIPPYRSDVKRPIDAMEEIIRIAGFSAIPAPKKWSFSVPVAPALQKDHLRSKLALALASKGFNEVMNNSLTKSKYTPLHTDKQAGKAIELRNPLSQDLAVLRTTLLFGLLETISYNRNRQSGDLKLFEMGQSYHGFGDKYTERSLLGLAVTGNYQPTSWLGSRSFTLFDLKGHVLDLLEATGNFDMVERSFQDEGGFSEGIHCTIQGKKIATLGVISKEWLKAFDLKQQVFAAQIDLNAMYQMLNGQKVIFQEIPKTFQVRRDFAFVVNHEVEYASLATEARKAASHLLTHIGLFDVYEGEKLEQGKKSYAMAFYFRDAQKTLTDDEIDAEMDAIRQRLAKSLGATLR
jgi:phenylalanyl-tRNA synthetase beta chain